MNENNSTPPTNGSGGGVLTEGNIDVHQGPAWLVDVLFNPPTWLATVFGLVVLASLLVAGVSLYRSNWEVDSETQTEMLENAAIIEGVMVATVLFVWYAEYSYAIDVAGGFIFGVLGAYTAITAAQSSRGARVLKAIGVDTATRERFVAAWFLVAGVGVVPFLLAGGGAVPIILRGGVLLAGAGVVLGAYNASDLVENDLGIKEADG